MEYATQDRALICRTHIETESEVVVLYVVLHITTPCTSSEKVRNYQATPSLFNCLISHKNVDLYFVRCTFSQVKIIILEQRLCVKEVSKKTSGQLPMKHAC